MGVKLFKCQNSKKPIKLLPNDLSKDKTSINLELKKKQESENIPLKTPPKPKLSLVTINKHRNTTYSIDLSKEVTPKIEFYFGDFIDPGIYEPPLHKEYSEQEIAP